MYVPSTHTPPFLSFLTILNRESAKRTRKRIISLGRGLPRKEVGELPMVR